MATNGDIAPNKGEGHYDVIIVGAGLAGLTAAYTILQKKPAAKVLVIEATEEIGGNISSGELKSASGTSEWDFCGVRIGSSQQEILHLVNELGLETYPQYNTGNKFWRLPDGKLKKFSGAIPPLPMTVLLDVVRYFKKVDGMQGQIKLDRVHQCKHAEEWDGMTVEEFLKKYLWTQVGRTTIETMTKSFCGSLGSEMTMMQYLYIINTCGGWDLHINSGDKGRMDLKIKGGGMTLCRKLSDKLGRENIVFGESVTDITETKNNTEVKVTTTSGKEYHTQRVIVALPCNLAGKIKYDPPLRTNRGRTFALGYDMMASVLTYKSAFWREAGHAGEFMNMAATLNSRHATSRETLIVSFDVTLPGGDPALMTVANPANLKGKSKEERKDVIVGVLSEVFGPQTRDCLDYGDRVWSHESVTDEDMAPVNHSSELLAGLTKQHGRVHWAGADSATSWSRTFNGAVQSGQRSAQEVIANV